MKVYIHIPNCGDYMDDDILVEVKCGGTPRIGDNFFMSEKVRMELMRQIFNAGKKKVWEYSMWINSVAGGYAMSFGDCTTVTDLAWRPSESGEFECHIELGDNLDRTEMLPANLGDWNDEEFDFIYKSSQKYFFNIIEEMKNRCEIPVEI